MRIGRPPAGARPIINAPDLEEAVRIAVAEMAGFLVERLGVSREEAFLLLTARGDVRIGQAARCGIDATAYVRFPKLAPGHPAPPAR